MKSIQDRDNKHVLDSQRIPSPGRGLPRALNIVLASAALIVTSPLLLASAVMVALGSPGGVLFRQQRVGRDGHLFTLYKLRTMRPSVDGPQVTSGNDARITKSGKFLRKTKLDELPTFWNVVKGDMALVGPRPEVPRYVKFDDPVWQRILEVRPGITDPITLQLRNEEELLAHVAGDPEEYYLNELQPQKLKAYLEYLQKRNWLTDINVLCQTLLALVVPQRHAGSLDTHLNHPRK